MILQKLMSTETLEYETPHFLQSLFAERCHLIGLQSTNLANIANISNMVIAQKGSVVRADLIQEMFLAKIRVICGSCR